MLTPTRTTADPGPAPAAEAPFRFSLDDVLVRDAQSCADMMARAAVALCVTGAGYGHHGRGPHYYDEIGLVRAAAQAVVDWDAWRRDTQRPPQVADWIGYPAEQGRGDLTACARLVREWGLQEAGRASGGNVLKDAVPGDVLLYMGRGPLLGVVVAPWRDPGAYPHFEGPAVATVFAPNPPRVARDCRMSHTAVALYRWPERLL